MINQQEVMIYCDMVHVSKMANLKAAVEVDSKEIPQTTATGFKL